MGCSIKVCTKCRIEKYLEDFYKDCHSKDGYAFQCKDCRKEYTKHYSKTDAYKKRIRKYKWKEAGIDITHEEYEVLLEQQNYKCAICKTDKNQFGKGMCVDHNHCSGKIRGLLCTSCNLAIQHLKESPEIMTSAIEYIEKYEGKK